MIQEEMHQPTEYNTIQLTPEGAKHSCTVFNPIFEISKLPFAEAKELMWKGYRHKLTEDEYALMPTADSPVDFFKKSAGLGATSGICRQCGCKWDSPCIDEIHGACWWVDKNRTLCSHCFYGFNNEPFQMKVYYRPGYDWLERDREFAEETLRDPRRHWVYDMEHDVLCVVGLGDHIGAVRFIAKKFYGLDRIYREEIPKWQEIIAENMIFYNAMVDDPEHYAWHLPRKYRTED